MVGQQVIYYKDSPYVVTGYKADSPELNMQMDDKRFNYLLGSNIIRPLQSQSKQPLQPINTGNTAAQLQSYLNRMTSNASNALNGGLLGYMPSSIMSAGSNPSTLNGPQGGNLSSSLSGMQGLLGASNPSISKWRGY